MQEKRIVTLHTMTIDGIPIAKIYQNTESRLFFWRGTSKSIEILPKGVNPLKQSQGFSDSKTCLTHFMKWMEKKTDLASRIQIDETENTPRSIPSIAPVSGEITLTDLQLPLRIIVTSEGDTLIIEIDPDKSVSIKQALAKNVSAA